MLMLKKILTFILMIVTIITTMKGIINTIEIMTIKDTIMKIVVDITIAIIIVLPNNLLKKKKE
jgi:hypothetical protein